MDKTFLELFSGSGNMAAAFKEAGYKVLTIDNDLSLSPDICIDILNFDINKLPPEFRNPTVVWASPPCTAFSVCTISRNWSNGRPISDKALLGISLVKKTVGIIKELKPKYWFVENPRGMLRKLGILDPIGARRTVTYCQYGLDYQKPTDIWTNSLWIPRKPCRSGDNCHEYQPRSYQRKINSGVIGLGVQGLKNAYERGVIPVELCKEIVRYCEDQQKEKQEALL